MARKKTAETEVPVQENALAAAVTEAATAPADPTDPVDTVGTDVPDTTLHTLAAALLYRGTGDMDPDTDAFKNRVRAAYRRARVMLEISKES